MYCDAMCVLVSLCVCVHVSLSDVSIFHKTDGYISPDFMPVACGCGSTLRLAALGYVMHFRFCGWRHFVHNRPGKGDANSTYTQWIQMPPGGRMGLIRSPIRRSSEWIIIGHGKKLQRINEVMAWVIRMLLLFSYFLCFVHEQFLNGEQQTIVL